MEPLTLIFGASALAIAHGLVKKWNEPVKDEDVSKMNELFKIAKICNKKEEPEFAYVKWVDERTTYKMFGVEIPSGCDIKALVNMRYAIENVFKNDVDIIFDEQNYRIKIAKGKLLSGNAYPFQRVPIKDTNHLYATIGVTLDGPMTINLSDTLPNILLAGTAGAGKSRLVKSIICQLLENYTSEELKLYYLDNKGGIEASAFKNVKHLVNRSRSVEETIIQLIEIRKEMIRRNDVLERNDVTNIVDYNAKVSKENKLPFMFVVIDELFSFATLPASPPNRTEMTFEQRYFNRATAYRIMAEIASMCRAAGIHLMFCTQRPTSDVIPTSITCNCGIRLGLRTANEQESRNIIEEDGLELISLDAKGLGIVKTDGLDKFQTFWITDTKIKEVCDRNKKQIEAIKKDVPQNISKRQISNIVQKEDENNTALRQKIEIC